MAENDSCLQLQNSLLIKQLQSAGKRAISTRVADPDCRKEPLTCRKLAILRWKNCNRQENVLSNLLCSVICFPIYVLWLQVSAYILAIRWQIFRAIETDSCGNVPLGRRDELRNRTKFLALIFLKRRHSKMDGLDQKNHDLDGRGDTKK